MTKTRLGSFEKGSLSQESYQAFIPPILPPEPALSMDSLFMLYDRASLALGRLDGVHELLPDIDLFLFMYVRKEAVLSSQIEGTQSSLSDLLLFENHEMPKVNDVEEVSGYVRAINYGMEKIKDNFPLSLRLIKEMHHLLLAENRGKDKAPGEFRRSQNWLGPSSISRATFVPPPPDKIMGLLDNLEKFMHDEKITYPPLLRAAIAHVQFETIHPFLDGNGRLGRLLIPLLLCQYGVLKEPLLYLSLYFKKHRQQYYDLLQKVRYEGAWEEWTEFFLFGVRETAEQAYSTAIHIRDLFHRDGERIGRAGRKSSSGLMIHRHFMKHPFSSIADIVKATGLSEPAVIKNIRYLLDIRLLAEITGKKRNKIFLYKEYFDLINQDKD